MKIYLAGGMKSDWQDKIMEACPQHTYFDPRTHGLTDPFEYTKWDLEHVAESDLVFSCFTLDNPSGFGMCIEIGSAHRGETPIILVDEQQLKSWAIVRSCCDAVFDNIEAGIEYLKELSK
jgi:hypothetical protein